MDTQLSTAIQGTVKYWFLKLIMGILFIVVAILIFVTPSAAFITLILFFSASLLISGVIEIFSSVLFRKELDNWGWSLVTGIIDLLMGAIFISKPEISAVVLSLLVGFVVLYRSIMAIAWSIDLKRFKITSWGMLMGAGIIGLIFSFLLLMNPAFAGLTIVLCAGIAFLMIGISQIQISLILRKFKEYLK